MRKNTATYFFLGLAAATISSANAATTPTEQPNLDNVSIDASETPKAPPTNKNGDALTPPPMPDSGQNSELKHDINVLAAKYNLTQTQIKDIQDDATEQEEPPPGAETFDETMGKLKSMQSDRDKTAGVVDLKTLDEENENHHDKDVASHMTFTVDAYRLKGSEDDVNEKYKILSENADPSRKAFIDSAKSLEATPIIQKAKIPVALNKYGVLTTPSAYEDLKTKMITTPDGLGVKNISYGDAVYIMSPQKSDINITLGFHDIPCQFTESASICPEYSIMEKVDNAETTKIIKSDYNKDDQSIDVVRYSVKIK